MNETIHISSLLVSVNPARIEKIKNELGAIPIAEIAHCDPKGKIIVTLETDDEFSIVQALTDIQILDGVVSAALVFHQIDEAAAIDEINST